ncbi:asparagine synthase (glutamine-hydrolyzing) [Haematospirillum jordaniae]|uniref:asparagine synthase (glutamine-hydrolyzing) n=1 Tax=Haematospirillum jordaniae TaxID=1549855 RepID=UPI001432AC18|nr:asparagine synthase (glutamine-hydrolyzing) [Haematospirillum jordaniae]NKD45103.1 asparagine synthase (glutamine-hydrolyzing) [Haematospirillum jordaniae]NKD86127.1 asparagine synthase (glutamine-hydrolyzing) [Haematospirillum jordaniae]NKD92826.1 asparagine synthase (glutamine-hydrolyzing) [Haematospirillum jordaniae]
MCGIGGVYPKSAGDIELHDHLRGMLDIQHHRGPDARGLWMAEDQHMGLCHNRLAILDLTDSGNQPLRSIDGRLVIVFNGEIYNHKELRRELELKGVTFRSHTDTEVLVEAYRFWGEDMLQKLRGMFAFAIYDLESRNLFCARDHVGKKPFIYAQTDRAFIFASEVPAVRQVKGVNKRYDHAAIAAMFLHNLRHIPDPHTAYAGIKKLRPGHAMMVRNGQVQRIWRYWIPAQSKGLLTPERLREILEESVRLRMQADVPVGALLSGGVDSSAIVALMQGQSSVPVHTYALGFNADDEDLHRARLMAEQLGTCHRELYFDPDEQWKIFEKLLGTYGEPIMLLPLVHTYALSRAIQEDGIKVVLTGNGADELFFGYTGHIRTLKVSRWLDRVECLRRFLPSMRNTRLGWVFAKPGERKAAWYRSIAKSEWAPFLTSDAQMHLANVAADELAYWGDLCPSPHFIDESNFVGLMVENAHSVTIAGDLPAMAASVEFRSPFLDQEIVSFALATPADKKIPDLKNPNWLKAILRESVRDLVPDSLLRAPKRGFGMGIQEANVLSGPWRERASDLLADPNDVEGLLDVVAVRAEWQGFLDGVRPANRSAKQLAVQAWLRIQGSTTHACS